MEFINIIVFGDSLAYGMSDAEFGGWVNRLKIYLDNYEEKVINIFNLSIPGEVTEETLRRFRTECDVRTDKNKKTIIVFAIGINDTQYVNEKCRVPTWQFIRNIKALIYEAKKFASNILFIGLSKVDEAKVVPVFWDKNKSYLNKKIKQFDNLIEIVCCQEMILYLKIYDIISLNDLSDGLHFNERGHKKVNDMVLSSIISIIENY